MPAPPPSSGANSQQALLAQQQKRDPARDAINHSRDKRMHEVVASMLTTLHAEALSKEQGVLLLGLEPSAAHCMCSAHRVASKAARVLAAVWQSHEFFHALAYCTAILGLGSMAGLLRLRSGGVAAST